MLAILVKSSQLSRYIMSHYVKSCFIVVYCVIVTCYIMVYMFYYGPYFVVLCDHVILIRIDMYRIASHNLGGGICRLCSDWADTAQVALEFIVLLKDRFGKGRLCFT